MCCGERRGETLGNLIAELQGDMTNEELGDAAGISASTVGQIKGGSIECPPRSRLERLASALGVGVGRLISAAEADGCEYSEENSYRPRVSFR